MPRIARPPDPATEGARKDLAAYLAETGRSLNSLAVELDICQSTLHRFVTGRTKSITPRIRPALEYVHNISKKRITLCEQSSDNVELRAALRRAWPESPEAVEFLGQLIDAIGPLVVRHCSLRPHEGKSKK